MSMKTFHTTLRSVATITATVATLGFFSACEKSVDDAAEDVQEQREDVKEERADLQEARQDLQEARQAEAADSARTPATPTPVTTTDPAPAQP